MVPSVKLGKPAGVIYQFGSLLHSFPRVRLLIGENGTGQTITKNYILQTTQAEPVDRQTVFSVIRIAQQPVHKKSTLWELVDVILFFLVLLKTTIS